jgi:hypothetical protein
MSRAFRLGMSARAAKKPRRDNPFPPNTDQYRFWELGWFHEDRRIMRAKK